MYVYIYIYMRQALYEFIHRRQRRTTPRPTPGLVLVIQGLIFRSFGRVYGTCRIDRL